MLDLSKTLRKLNKGKSLYYNRLYKLHNGLKQRESHNLLYKYHNLLRYANG